MPNFFSQQNKFFFVSKIIVSIIFIWGCFSLPSLISGPNLAQESTEDKTPDILEPNYGSKIEKDVVGSESPSTLGKNPIEVDSGVYVKSFGSFDYDKNTFFTNFCIWWLMDEGVKYVPEDTLEIANGQQWIRLWSARDKIHTRIRVQARYYGTVNHVWTMKYFPFDRQKIRISIEDNIADIEQVKFIPLSKDSRLSPDIKLTGWNLLNFDLVQEPHSYNANFGDVDHPVSITSRLNIIIEMKREGWQIFFVYFIGYFVAIFLSFLTYFMPTVYFSEASTLCLAAIFASIGTKNQLGFSLSGTKGLSFSGIFTLCTFSIVLITIVNTVLTHRLYVDDRRSLSIKINYSIFFALIILLTLIMGVALLEAVNS